MSPGGFATFWPFRRHNRGREKVRTYFCRGMKQASRHIIVTTVLALLLLLMVAVEAYSTVVKPELLVDPHAGKPITRESWRTRRCEILELFKSRVFGRVPNTLYDLDANVVTEDSRALEGRATLQIVHLTIRRRTSENDEDDVEQKEVNDNSSFTFPVHIFLPNHAESSKKCPAFLLIVNRSRKVLDPYQKTSSEYWPVPNLVEQGFATAAFFAGDMDPDDQNDDFLNGVHPILDVEPRTDESWGCIAAWAFGCSRVLDYLVTKLPHRVDPNKVAVIGHSRGGKTALWAAAQDERFAMAISNNSGCTGAALSRRKADGRHGETIQQINEVFPNWFCKNYRTYNANEDVLPFDQHMLLALIAPRALCVASATQDDWADPGGEYLSFRAATHAWSLLLDESSESRSDTPLVPPLPEEPLEFFQTDRLSYHLRPGKHDLLLYDWQRFMSLARCVFRMPRVVEDP